MRIILFIFSLVLVTFHSQCQELLLEREVKLTSIFKDKRESLPIINNDSTLTLILLDNNDIIGLTFSKNYKLVDSITVDRIDGKSKLLLGHSANPRAYNLFFANDNRSQFFVKTIDFKNKRSQIKPLDLELRKEKFLETFTYKNRFYLLTVKKMSSILNVYEFDGKINFSKHVIDLSEHEFASSGYSHLYDILLDEYISPKQVLKITKIENHHPNSLDIASAENKLYYFNDKLYLTLDNEDINTKLISIDLNNFSSEVKFIGQGHIEHGYNIKTKSNSYLLGNLLFQIRASADELYLSAYSVVANSLVNDYRVREGEKIIFSNTAFIQEGGTTIFTQESERELEKTKQVLRKIVAGDIGISVYKLSDKLELTVGGYKEVEHSGGGGAPVMGSPSTTMTTPHGIWSVPLAYSYNPTAFGYNKYKSTRSVYFKILIESGNCSHIKGDVQKNAFDKIQSYEENYEGSIASETIFKLGNRYIFGFYDKGKNKYYLRQFDDCGR